MNDSAENDNARSDPGEVGLVEARDFVSPDPFVFESGQTIPGFTLRYETYGRLPTSGEAVTIMAIKSPSTRTAMHT